MNSRTLRYPLAGGVLLAILFLSTVAVFHTDIDCAYNPRCPACQMEKTPASHTSAVVTANLLTAPTEFQYFVEGNAIGAFQYLGSKEINLRGPPAVR